MMLISFVCLSLAITRLPLATDATEPISSQLTDEGEPRNENNAALELILDTKTREIYFPGDNIHLANIALEENQKYFYACPKYLPWHDQIVNTSDKPCMFPKLITGTRKYVQCNTPAKPFIEGNEVDDDGIENLETCGRNSKGLMHEVYYRIYVGRNTENLEYLGENYTPSEREILFKTIHLYSACFYHQTRKTAYVKYDITSLHLSEQPIPTKFSTTFSQDGEDDIFRLNDAPFLYKKENQIHAIPFLNSQWNSNDDFITEQMLVPLGDLPEQQEKGSTVHYLNVAPQWKSLREDWIKLNRFIKNESVKVSLKSIKDPLAITYTRFSVFCGAYDILKSIVIPADQSEPTSTIEACKSSEPNHNKELERNEIVYDIGELKKSKLSTQIPLFWWQYVRNSNREGILFVMPNYPKGIPIPTSIPPFCPDICDLHGWNFVKQINPTIICCQATYDLLGILMYRGYLETAQKILTISSATGTDQTTNDVRPPTLQQIIA